MSTKENIPEKQDPGQVIDETTLEDSEDDESSHESLLKVLAEMRGLIARADSPSPAEKKERDDHGNCKRDDN